MAPRRHFRFSPTSIVEGREQGHLETLVARQEQYELDRLADQQAFNARLQNINCPYEREKEKIIYDFSDRQNNLSFQEAWLKIDEVEQKQSDETYELVYAVGGTSPHRHADHHSNIV